MFYQIILLHMYCFAIEAVSVTSMQSKSAFGKTVKENTKATGVKLVRSTSNAASLIACNLGCLNDNGCGATNYLTFSSSSHRVGGECQLLSHEYENDATFEHERHAIYTKLIKVKSSCYFLF